MPPPPLREPYIATYKREVEHHFDAVIANRHTTCNGSSIHELNYQAYLFDCGIHICYATKVTNASGWSVPEVMQFSVGWTGAGASGIARARRTELEEFLDVGEALA